LGNRDSEATHKWAGEVFDALSHIEPLSSTAFLACGALKTLAALALPIKQEVFPKGPVKCVGISTVTFVGPMLILLYPALQGDTEKLQILMRKSSRRYWTELLEQTCTRPKP
jgi:hypothetical protein